MLLWSLWKWRNTKLWEGKLEDFKQVMARASEVLNSWLFARNSQSVPVRTDLEQLYSLVPPSNGYVKCNIDAAIFKSKQHVGVGACLRDGTGQFKRAFSTWCSFFMDPSEGEAWGLLQTLNWLVSMDLECIISQCRTPLSFKNNYKVVFTRRQANGSVHALAQASINYAIHNTFTRIPHCIWNIIMNEMR
jgi:hypothetical protein